MSILIDPDVSGADLRGAPPQPRERLLQEVGRVFAAVRDVLQALPKVLLGSGELLLALGLLGGL